MVDFDDYGLFADLDILGITQRFRYIEPNTFMMGSPETEVGRDDDEDYHQVTLTQGYWLADTACTQELWQAVMGDNPADFKDSPDNPVENVSWLDVQNFIGKLKKQMPKLLIQLPSEAQWENACRAGTTTPFSFDGEINLERVNYRGTLELEEDEKGDYRWHEEAKQKTVSTKLLASNPWGLYEMHGNVWEWCFDEWKENLGSDPAVDPIQAQFKSGVKPDPAGESLTSPSLFNSEMLENAGDADVQRVPRVLRGGSWGGDGRLCRSAIRSRYAAADRGRDIGFRLSLGLELKHSTVSRSDTVIETGGSEQTEENRERAGAADGLDQTASGSGKGMLSKMKDWFGGKNET